MRNDFSSTIQSLGHRLARIGLVRQIILGLVAGILLAVLWPAGARHVALLGTLFVTALKSVAPILVFVLVLASIADHKRGQKTHIRPVLWLYMLGVLSAAIVAVTASFLFPLTLTLVQPSTTAAAPSSIAAVLENLALSLVDNPVKALMEGNFISILAWAIGLGLALRHAGATTQKICVDLAEAVSHIVRWVIRLAPLGIFGLVSSTLAQAGLSALLEYLHVLAVLVGCMLVIALVVNPAIVFWRTRRNPYPLVWICLRESGITAFFTRSSVANIPLNLALCERLGLHEDTYSLSIPLGATINMAGAAITITVLTMATVHTLGIAVDLPTALLLCIVASVAACGVSGVAGGSLLLVPLASSLFGISTDIAMQVVAVGFVISVVQDSAETALNSSTDVLFTAAACIAAGEIAAPVDSDAIDDTV